MINRKKLMRIGLIILLAAIAFQTTFSLPKLVQASCWHQNSILPQISIVASASELTAPSTSFPIFTCQPFEASVSVPFLVSTLTTISRLVSISQPKPEIITNSSSPTTPNSTTSQSEPVMTSSFARETEGKDYSSLRSPKTITLCNYTTPPDTGTIVRISIFLMGSPEGSQVKAVIFTDNPQSHFPLGREPVAESLETVNVTLSSGAWYNFTMNYKASQNTVYWLGYYSDGYTRYFFDVDINCVSLTSEPIEEQHSLLPVSWSYEGNSIMSLFANYSTAPPQPLKNQTSPNWASTSPETTSFQYTLLILLIMGAEFVAAVAYQLCNKRTITSEKISNKLRHLFS